MSERRKSRLANPLVATRAEALRIAIVSLVDCVARSNQRRGGQRTCVLVSAATVAVVAATQWVLSPVRPKGAANLPFGSMAGAPSEPGGLLVLSETRDGPRFDPVARPASGVPS